MGMFDYIRCQYPLPIEGANDIIYQTKDMTEWPGFNVYEIRKDGTIWREDYDIVDKGKKDGSSVDHSVDAWHEQTIDGIRLISREKYGFINALSRMPGWNGPYILSKASL